MFIRFVPSKPLNPIPTIVNLAGNLSFYSASSALLARVSSIALTAIGVPYLGAAASALSFAATTISIGAPLLAGLEVLRIGRRLF